MIGDLAGHLDRAEVIVAEAGGEIVGTVTFYEDASLAGQGDWPPGSAAVLRLAVLPGHRGRGTGRALLEECVRHCRDRGIDTLALHTATWMAVARDMYERRGFVRVPEYDFLPRSGIEALAYKLEVGKGSG
jgi:ribosomal protein S18 acetylase RimI-like enzyme